MFGSTPSTQAVSACPFAIANPVQVILIRAVVPSKMNPVEEGDNQFAELFKAMPAARIGKMEDIAGAVLYLSSQAGVSPCFLCANIGYEVLMWL